MRIREMVKSDELLGNVFCFEGFRLDATRRSLHRDGAEVDLRAKCFDLLTCLARNAGRVATKEELITAVWRNVVVTDESLTPRTWERRSPASGCPALQQDPGHTLQTVAIATLWVRHG
jgi:DNA-binding response OmpR family regulator